MNLLTNLKILLGISGTDKDSLLNLLIADAEDDFLDITHLEEVPSKASGTVLQMAIVKYNRIGAEGLNSQSQSGLSESYEGYGEDIMRRIKAYRRLVTV